MGKPSLPFDEYLGKSFGRLTVIGDLGLVQRRWQRTRMVRCRCACGNEADCILTEVKAGRQVSCGCAARDAGAAAQRTHSMTGTRVYRIWLGMRHRCNNENASGYENYGGRGITYDPRWESFETFLEDMGLPPSDEHTLDRELTDGNYCKANCRWVTMAVQQRSRRNSVILEYGGKRLNLVDWARELGIHPMTLRVRLDKGWPLDQALTRGKMDRNDPRWGELNGRRRHAA